MSWVLAKDERKFEQDVKNDLRMSEVYTSWNDITILMTRMKDQGILYLSLVSEAGGDIYDAHLKLMYLSSALERAAEAIRDDWASKQVYLQEEGLVGDIARAEALKSIEGV